MSSSMVSGANAISHSSQETQDVSIEPIRSVVESLFYNFDANTYLKQSIDEDQHKGFGGRIIIIGGSHEYSGAPFFVAAAALNCGIDLPFILTPSSAAAAAIKSYSPELIVHCISDGLPVEKIVSLCPSVISIGSGLGRGNTAERWFNSILTSNDLADTPIIVDADGLHFLAHRARGRKRGLLVLTPNGNELNVLAQAVASKVDKNKCGMDGQLTGTAAAVAIAKFFNAAVFVKGRNDVIVVGDVATPVHQSQAALRRCGGQGDVLTGVVAACTSRLTKAGQQSRTALATQLTRAAIITRAAAQDAATHYGLAMSARDMLDALRTLVAAHTTQPQGPATSDEEAVIVQVRGPGGTVVLLPSGRKATFGPAHLTGPMPSVGSIMDATVDSRGELELLTPRHVRPDSPADLRSVSDRFGALELRPFSDSLEHVDLPDSLPTFDPLDSDDADDIFGHHESFTTAGQTQLQLAVDKTASHAPIPAPIAHCLSTEGRRLVGRVEFLLDGVGLISVPTLDPAKSPLVMSSQVIDYKLRDGVGMFAVFSTKWASTPAGQRDLARGDIVEFTAVPRYSGSRAPALQDQADWLEPPALVRMRSETGGDYVAGSGTAPVADSIVIRVNGKVGKWEQKAVYRAGASYSGLVYTWYDREGYGFIKTDIGLEVYFRRENLENHMTAPMRGDYVRLTGHWLDDKPQAREVCVVGHRTGHTIQGVVCAIAHPFILIKPLAVHVAHQRCDSAGEDVAAALDDVYFARVRSIGATGDLRVGATVTFVSDPDITTHLRARHVRLSESTRDTPSTALITATLGGIHWPQPSVTRLHRRVVASVDSVDSTHKTCTLSYYGGQAVTVTVLNSGQVPHTSAASLSAFRQPREGDLVDAPESLWALDAPASLDDAPAFLLPGDEAMSLLVVDTEEVDGLTLTYTISQPFKRPRSDGQLRLAPPLSCFVLPPSAGTDLAPGDQIHLTLRHSGPDSCFTVATPRLFTGVFIAANGTGQLIPTASSEDMSSPYRSDVPVGLPPRRQHRLNSAVEYVSSKTSAERSSGIWGMGAMSSVSVGNSPAADIRRLQHAMYGGMGDVRMLD